MLSHISVCVVLGLVASTAADLGPCQRVSQRRAAIAPRQDVPEDCTFFDSITSPDQDCADLASFWGITTEEFISWVCYPALRILVLLLTLPFAQNPRVGKDCSSIEVGEEYCVERNWGLPISSSTTSGGVPEPTSTVPSPVQSGIVDGRFIARQ